MFLTTFQYKPEHMDCKLCQKYVKGKGCTADGCPWLAERIQAGTVDYAEAVREAFPHNDSLNARLHTVIRCFTGSVFLTAAHRQRMERTKNRVGHRKRRDTPAYFAAMYLLTSNEQLYSRTRDCFVPNGLKFEFAYLYGISPGSYTLLSAARDIYTDSTKVSVSDLANAEIVDTIAFGLIVNAMLIARYGCAVLEIGEGSRT